jgi:hypothetical protein
VRRWFVMVTPDSVAREHVGHTAAGAAYALAERGARAAMARHLRAECAWIARRSRRPASVRRFLNPYPRAER